MNFNPISLFAAFVITYFLTPVVKKVALSLKILDLPDKRKIHNSPIPLLGSIAVYLGFLAGLFLSGFHSFPHRELLIIFSAATMLLVVGILDDAGFLHP